MVIDGGGVASASNQVPYLAEAYAAMGYGLILPTASDTEYGVPEAFRNAGIAVLERPAAGSAGPLPTHVLEIAGWKVVVIVGPDEPDADPEFLAGRYVAQAPPPGEGQRPQPAAAVPQAPSGHPPSDRRESPREPSHP